MKIAIHHNPGSYSEKWIKYCEENNIPHKIVSCYSNNIIEDIRDCKALMWHYHHKDSKDTILARQLMNAIEHSGKTVYPDFKTNWFFDDKIAQKYLLEAIEAPLVPSYVFYSKKEALDWIRQTTFPKVFKLRKGAGSANVKLIRSRKEAVKITRKAFGSGFRQYNPREGLKERWRTFRKGKADLIDLIQGFGRFFIRTKFEKIAGRERGYVYFQDFIEGCSFDIRTTVVGNKCYALKRMVRKNDFRASGSHDEIHDPKEIPAELIEITFQISKRLDLQSVAFDFLITPENKPLITEMSYAFGWDEGDAKIYWDSELHFHYEPFNPFAEMVNNIISRAGLK